MSEESNIYELGAEVSAEEIAEFEDRADEIAAEVAEIVDVDALADEPDEVQIAATLGMSVEDATVSGMVADAMEEVRANSSYKVVNLIGRFTSANGNWGTTTKNLGCVAHYDGGNPVPDRAWNDPVSWIKFISGLHAQTGRFSPGWYFDGIAYCEMIVHDTVYRCRSYAAKLPHCGNLEFNGGGIGMQIPVGGNQRPSDASYRTFFARVADHNKAMGLGRAATYGHREVGSSSCPGNIFQGAISEFRRGQNPGGSAPSKPAPSKPAPSKPSPSKTLYTVEADGKQTGVYSNLGKADTGALWQAGDGLKKAKKITITKTGG